ncbi:MAG: hypothetical protein EOO18_05630 [Chryseobacterium sp.]|nr:MAG: hypothetical protein EOO18_05630 [Chryseobacterium sp.]
MKLLLLLLILSGRVEAQLSEKVSVEFNHYSADDLCLINTADELIGVGRFSRPNQMYEFLQGNIFRRQEFDCVSRGPLQIGTYTMDSTGVVVFSIGGESFRFNVYRFERHLILIEESKLPSFLKLFNSSCAIINNSRSTFAVEGYPEFTRSYMIAGLISEKYLVSFD